MRRLLLALVLVPSAASAEPAKVDAGTVVVTARAPAPQVVYLTRPKRIAYSPETSKQDFLPLIVASVKELP